MKKLIFTLAVCLFALNGMAQKHDWAGFGRFAKENAQVAVRPDAVFMGNSITEGWAYQDPEFFKQNNFVGRGISGQTTAQMLCRFRPDVLAHNPKCVVIMAGTNDVAENNGYISHENILNNIISMVQLAQANDIKVILCSVPPTSVFSWRRDLKPGPAIVELNKLIKAWADENKVYYLDYHSSLADEVLGLPKKWSNDTCHPNLECYRTVMEPMVCEALNKVLKPSKKKQYKPIPYEAK